MDMKNIITLEQITDYEIYNPILVFSEDLDFDNKFCVLRTNVGYIGFSYYDYGIAPSYIIYDAILFLSFGRSYYIVNLKDNNIVHQSRDSLSIIFEIVKNDIQSCVVFIGEMSLICFSLKGKKIWENNYRNAICDWYVVDDGVIIFFDNNEKWLVLFKDGNGLRTI